VKKRDTYAQIMAVLLHLPWPVELGLGVFFYLFFDGMSQNFGPHGPADPTGLRPLVAHLASALAVALPAVLIASALASLLKGRPPKS